MKGDFTGKLLLKLHLKYRMSFALWYQYETKSLSHETIPT